MSNTFKILILSAVLNFSIMLHGKSQNSSIAGKIIDKTKQKPISFANIEVLEQNKGTLSNENGEFFLSDLAQKTIILKISHINYETRLIEVDLLEVQQKVTIEMELAKLETEEIVISGGNYSSQHENAIKIESIKALEIFKLGNPSFMSAISSIPGVDIISKSPGVVQPSIRGLSQTNILVLNNGIKLENFQFSENHPLMVDETNISQVEVIKGPASLLYGSDAIGGVVNIIKEKPAPIGTIFGNIQSQYFSNTNGTSSSLNIKGSNNSFHWSGGAGIKSHMDYSDGNGSYIPNSRFNAQNLSLNLGLTKKFGIFDIYYDYNKYQLGVTLKNVIPQITENSRKNEIWYQDLSNHLLTLKSTLFIKKSQLHFNFAYQHNNRKLQTDQNQPVVQTVDMDFKTFSYESKFSTKLHEKANLIIGFQGANKSNKNNESPNHIIPDATINDLGLFSLLQLSLGEKLKTQFGFRYDIRSIETQEDGNKDATNNTYANWSATAGATYDISKKLFAPTKLSQCFSLSKYCRTYPKRDSRPTV